MWYFAEMLGHSKLTVKIEMCSFHCDDLADTWSFIEASVKGSLFCNSVAHRNLLRMVSI